MDRLWAPWRSEYIASSETADSDPKTCIFCELHSDPNKDEERFVLHRAAYNFVALNLYPYISGHLLIIPYEHTGDLASAAKETTDELMDLTKRAQSALREVYQPHGFNVGMNLGRPAGAGIADHIHIHMLPRWNGDTNFMTAVGQTRVLSEALTTTYQKLRGKI